MAATNVTPVIIKKMNNNVTMPDLVALDASAGALIPMGNRDDKTLIFVQNGGSGKTNITFKAGDAIQGATDLVVSVTNGKTECFVVESGRFLVTKGQNRGKMLVTGTADLKVGAVVLP